MPRGIDKNKKVWYGVNMICRKCGSTKIVKNGTQKRWRGGVTYRVQHYLCTDCGRQRSKEIEESKEERIGGVAHKDRKVRIVST